MLSRFINPKHSEADRLRVVGAFPCSLASDVETVLNVIPVAKHSPSSNNIGLVSLDGESLKIPIRVYFPESGQSYSASLTKKQRTILTCIYTRHYDGYVRENYLREIIGAEEQWVVPFVLEPLGEYVIEIIQFIFRNTDQLKREHYSNFIKSNPEYCTTTSHRILSYWSCYFRQTSLFFSDHPGFVVAKELGLWDERVAKKLPKRKSATKAN